MKLKKSKKKGKVHPSPSSSSSTSSSSSSSSQILNTLLPTTILTLISVLSLQDRQTLAYMLTHSLNSSPHFHPWQQGPTTKNKNQKTTNNNHSSSSPCFDCRCFDCFSNFWNRWDSSPNRQLIDQAIEAFELHLASQEQLQQQDEEEDRRLLPADVEEREYEFVEGTQCGPLSAITDHKLQQQQQQQHHRGLARKVLPDVIGLFNSRLWNLWGPNV